MKLEEIKIGGVYDVRVKVMKKIPAPARGDFEIGAYTVDRTTQLPMEYEMSWFLTEETPAFAEITPENGTKNTATAPKYDPCRLFKAGDIVRIIDWNGRTPDMLDEKGTREAVVADPEDPRSGSVELLYNDRYPIVAACFLELITPVEELKPYYVEEEGHSWCVRKLEHSDLYSTLAWFSKNRHPNAKAAAEAECARLNAEHRKEQTEK